MTVKGDNHGERFPTVRVGDGLADDLLVAEVDTVEHADGSTDTTRAGLKRTGVADHLHGC